MIRLSALLFISSLISLDGWTQNLLIGFNLNQLSYEETQQSFSPSGNINYREVDYIEGDFSIGYQTDKYVFRAIVGIGSWYHNRMVLNNRQDFQYLDDRVDTKKDHQFGIGIEKPYAYDKLRFYIGLNTLFHIRNGLRSNSYTEITNNDDFSSLITNEAIGRTNHNIRLHFISRIYYEFLPNLSVGAHLGLVMNYQFFNDNFYSEEYIYENQLLISEEVTDHLFKGQLFSQFVPTISCGLQYQINWKKKNSIDCSGLFNNKK